MARKRKKQPHNVALGMKAYQAAKQLYGLPLVALIDRFDLRDNLFYRLTYAPKKARPKTSSKRKPGVSDTYTYVAYRFCGKPNAEQERALKQNTGAARWMWNRLKADNDDHYRELGYSLPNSPADYKDVSGLEWLNDVDSYALCNVQLQFERAMSDYFDGKAGKPRFHKKGRGPDSYTTNKNNQCNNIAIDRQGLTLPKIPGKIRLKMHRQMKPGGTLKSVTVTHEPDGKWFFSILVEYPCEELQPSANWQKYLETGDFSALRHIGLDMSLPYMYVDSENRHPSYTLDGHEVYFARPYRKLERKIAHEQLKLKRMVKGSNNYRKQQLKIAKLHAKAKHQRHDFLQQVSARLTASYDIISIEDLDLAAMKQALKFGKSVSDIGWGMFVELLQQKCLHNGTVLVQIERWFPSSKTCSHCGHVHKDLQLGERTFVCPKCGHEMDRDWQAATTIDAEGCRLVRDALASTSLKKQKRRSNYGFTFKPKPATA